MLRKIEWGVAVLLTALAAGLHFVFMRHAGGLWRDEAGTLYLAVMPRLADVWAHLHYDSFPIFWVLVLRVWAALGLADDGGLRLLGFLVGVSVLGTLWFNARCFRISFPIISMLLLGFCPAMIIWGDSMRAWGWGVLWILVTLGLVWRVVESPTAGKVILASLAAIGSVQSTYYNAVMLFAICAGGMAVAARHRLWKTGAAVLGIGLTAAISLLPYLGVFRRGAAEYIILRSPYGMKRFIEGMVEASQIPGTPILVIGVMLFAAGIGLAISCQYRPADLKATSAQRDLLLFSVITLVTALAAYFGFLKMLHFHTSAWYYITLLAVGAVTLDAMLSVAGNQAKGSIVRLLLATITLATVFLPVWRSVHLRLTNADMVAKTIANAADKGDLVVVNPWYCAISFQRYYSGPAAWVGLPDVKDYQVHHYDTIKEMMVMPEPADAIRDVCQRMEETLKSGKRVWMVAGPVAPGPTGPAPRLLPAPMGPSGWDSGYYGAVWASQAIAFVGLHLTNGHIVELPAGGAVNPFEDLKLLKGEGWRENQTAKGTNNTTGGN